MTINIQPIEKLSPSLFLEVHSIFLTIQGEGPFTGHPAVFVRLAGCNLQCPSCDTDYTSTREQRTFEYVADRVSELYPNKGALVVITGGEPFRQARAVSFLCDELIERGYKVQIETNGTLPPDGLDPDVVVVCSPKAGKVHPIIAKRADAWKYVLSYDSVDPFDGLPILALNHTASPRVARPSNNGPVYLQPMDAKNDAVNRSNLLAVIDSCLQHGYILQLQTHKIIGME